MKTAKRPTYALIFTSAMAAGLLMAVLIHGTETNIPSIDIKPVDQTVTILAKRVTVIEKITYDQNRMETALAAASRVNSPTKPVSEQASAKRLQTNAEFNKIMRKFA
jgi:hypothetical protein